MMSFWRRCFLWILARLEALRLRLGFMPLRWLQAWQDNVKEPEADFMQDAENVMIQQEPVRARVLLHSVMIVLILFLVWTALVDVDEITKGEAKVIPSQQVQVYPSLDGGIVTAIKVHEGQLVEKDQVLLQIDPTRFESSVNENRASYLSLLAKAARLRALGDGTPFVAPEEVLKEDPKTAEEEARLFENSNKDLVSQIAIVKQQYEQRVHAHAEALARQKQASTAMESMQQELNATRPLLRGGGVSEVEILRLEREVARFRGERDVATAQIAGATAAIAEAANKIKEVESGVRNAASKELSETQSRLNSLVQSSTGLVDKVKQSSILSKVRGTVKRLLVNTVGGVVQPGRDVVEVVPSDGKLILEAKVAPKDIAFLVPGQRAVVKFTAYDFSTYGGLDGHLEHIGADSITDERGNTYYTVRVTTDRASLLGGQPIIPGMVAEVDIITGKKSILSYLLKPVLRAKQSALTER